MFPCMAIYPPHVWGHVRCSVVDQQGQIEIKSFDTLQSILLPLFYTTEIGVLCFSCAQVARLIRSPFLLSEGLA